MLAGRGLVLEPVGWHVAEQVGGQSPGLVDALVEVGGCQPVVAGHSLDGDHVVVGQSGRDVWAEVAGFEEVGLDSEGAFDVDVAVLDSTQMPLREVDGRVFVVLTGAERLVPSTPGLRPILDCPAICTALGERCDPEADAETSDHSKNVGVVACLVSVPVGGEGVADWQRLLRWQEPEVARHRIFPSRGSRSVGRRFAEVTHLVDGDGNE